VEDWSDPAGLLHPIVTLSGTKWFVDGTPAERLRATLGAAGEADIGNSLNLRVAENNTRTCNSDRAVWAAKKGRE